MIDPQMPIELQVIYDLVPKFNCQRCGGCCGPVQVEPIERQIIQQYCQLNKVPVKDFFGNLAERTMKAFNGKWQCPFLDDSGELCSCRIYPVRPFICRLQGLTSGLPCPNSKSKNYPLKQEIIMSLYKKMAAIKI